MSFLGRRQLIVLGYLFRTPVAGVMYPYICCVRSPRLDGPQHLLVSGQLEGRGCVNDILAQGILNNGFETPMNE